MKTAVLTILCIAISGSAFAAEQPIAARSGAMGGAFIALADDALAVYHNPAAMSKLNTISTVVSFGYGGFPFVENWSSLYAKPGYKGKHLGLGFIRQKIDYDGRGYRSFQLIRSSTVKISPSINSGINLKYITQKAGAASYKHKFSLDIGYHQRIGIFQLALMGRNIIDPKMRSYPREFIAGLGLNLEFMALELDYAGADWDELKSEERDLYLGGEFTLWQYFSIRAGWQDIDTGEFISLGFSMHSALHYTQLEYCYRAPKDNFNVGTHWISYSFKAF